MFKSIELKALKSCLGVKLSTPNDIVYTELNRADIIAEIKHRQYNFYRRFLDINIHESIAKQIWQNYMQLDVGSKIKPILQYYDSLSNNSRLSNRNDRLTDLSLSDNTMSVRYRSLFNLEYNDFLYNSMINDSKRMIITRWRLSSHKLFIETGRYKIPKIERNMRNCLLCNVVEDEYHALFVCIAHNRLRLKFHDLLDKYVTVHGLLNPKNLEDLNATASYLTEVEKNMIKLKIIQ